jgi:hypothetical protein
MSRHTLYKLASVAALALLPLACRDLGTGPKYPVDKPADPLARTMELGIDPKLATLAPGEGLQFEVTLRGAHTIPKGQPFIWESSDPSVAAVDGQGRLNALEPGEAVITVRYGEYEADAMIEVLTPSDGHWHDNH